MFSHPLPNSFPFVYSCVFFDHINFILVLDAPVATQFELAARGKKRGGGR